MKTITVNVTEEHIKAAMKEEGPRSRTCPIAQALREHFRNPGVGYDSFTAEGCEGRKRHFSAKLPERAQLFVIEADKNANVSPITFDVEVPGDI